MEDFNVGYNYISGSNLISFRNKEDVRDTWKAPSKGKNIVLWYDGLKLVVLARKGKQQKM